MNSPAHSHRLATIRAWIAGCQGSPAFRWIANLADTYHRAYNNEVNWDLAVNGEKTSLSAVLRDFPGEIIDVGANNGQWTRMAQELAPDRRIHLFEISPITFSQLCARLPASDLIVRNNLGLADRQGEITLHHYTDSNDRSSLIFTPDGFAKQELIVPVTSGDAYIAEQGIREIAYLKIDVEGFEMPVLEGFAAAFEAGMIHAVQFEHGVAHIYSGHFLKDFIEFFDGYGYRVSKIFPKRWIDVNYTAERDESFTGANFIALRR